MVAAEAASAEVVLVVSVEVALAVVAPVGDGKFFWPVLLLKYKPKSHGS